jgi:hypothetical protein
LAFCNISPEIETSGARSRLDAAAPSRPSPARADAFMVGKRPQRGGLIREIDPMIKTQAKDKNLHGAAMTSFVKKCTKDAMTM